MIPYPNGTVMEHQAQQSPGQSWVHHTLQIVVLPRPGLHIGAGSGVVVSMCHNTLHHSQSPT